MNTDIKPRLTLFDTIFVVINLVIGIGIFRTPALVASNVESSEMFFFSWLVGGIVALCGALTFAEIGARLPKAGGLYKAVSVSFHPLVAFMLNWTYILTLAVSTAGVALIGSEYIAPLFFPQNDPLINYQQLLVFGIILACFGTNFIGIRSGATTQKILTYLKMLLILVICSSVFFLPVSSVPVIQHSAGAAGGSNGFGTALVAVFYTLGGYQCTLNFGADVKNPVRNIPRAIIIGLLVIIALYFVLNAVYVKVLGFEQLSSSHLVAADVARTVWGDIGVRITSIAIFLSVLGFVNVYIMQTPRLLFAMAEDGILPSAFKKVNSRTQVQQVALTAFTVLTLLAALLVRTFESIVNYVIIIDSIMLSAVAFTIFILRKKEKKNSYNGYRIPSYPFLPIIFMVFLAYISISIFISKPAIALQGVGLILAGGPLYVLIKRFRKWKA